jgi:hypothetical protein
MTILIYTINFTYMENKTTINIRYYVLASSYELCTVKFKMHLYLGLNFFYNYSPITDFQYYNALSLC